VNFSLVVNGIDVHQICSFQRMVWRLPWRFAATGSTNPDFGKGACVEQAPFLLL